MCVVCALCVCARTRMRVCVITWNRRCGAVKIYVVQNYTAAIDGWSTKAILTLTEKTGPGYELSAICTVGPKPRIPRAKTILAPVRYG